MIYIKLNRFLLNKVSQTDKGNEDMTSSDRCHSPLRLSLPASSKEEVVHREEESRDLSPRPQKSEGPAGCR